MTPTARPPCGRSTPTPTSTVTAGWTPSGWMSTGTGCIDDVLADLDGDGMADHAVLDLDGDGLPEAYSPTTGRVPGRSARTGVRRDCAGSGSTAWSIRRVRWWISTVTVPRRAVVDTDGDGLADRASGRTGAMWTPTVTADGMSGCRRRRRRPRRTASQASASRLTAGARVCTPPRTLLPVQAPLSPQALIARAGRAGERLRDRQPVRRVGADRDDVERRARVGAA